MSENQRNMCYPPLVSASYPDLFFFANLSSQTNRDGSGTYLERSYGVLRHCQAEVTVFVGIKEMDNAVRVRPAKGTLIQGPAKRLSPGLVNFVPALAYHFCLALPATFTQPGDHFLAKP